MRQSYKCTFCKQEKASKDSTPFLYPGGKVGEPRKYVCTECHNMKIDKIKTAATKKSFLPKGKFGV